MKKLTLSAALMMTLIAGVAAEARSLKTNLSAQLTKIEIQADSSLSNYKISGGNILIDFYNKETTLILNRSFYCPAGKMCAQVMPSPLQFRVTNLEVSRGGCQEMVFTGVVDKLPVDGTRTEIQVVDNSSNVCMHIIPVPETEVVLKITAPRLTEETHVFEAGKLK